MQTINRGFNAGENPIFNVNKEDEILWNTFNKKFAKPCKTNVKIIPEKTLSRLEQM